MNTIRPVLFSLEPFPDESLAGLMGRVAEHNNYDQPSWLLLTIGAPARTMGWTQRELAQAAQILAVPEGDIASRAYLREGRNCKFFSHLIDARGLETVRYKHCPDCLTEFGYHSAVFDLKAVQACPLHAKRLVHACQQCGKGFRRGRSLFRCYHCEADRRDIRSEPVDLEELEVTKFIARAAGFPHAHAALERRVGAAEELAHWGLGDFLEAIAELGSYGLHGGKFGGYHRIGESTTLREIAHVHRVGYDAISDWPNGFRRYLSERIAKNRAARPRQNSLSSDLGSLRTKLDKTDSEPWTTLRKEAGRYLLARWDGIPVAASADLIERWTGEPLPYITLQEFVSRTQRGLYVSQGLIDLGVITVLRSVEGEDRARVIAIDRASADRICPVGKPLLRFSDLTQRLGLSPLATERLVKAGILSPVIGPGDQTRAKIKCDYFAAAAIDEFVLSLMPTTCPSRPMPEKTWTFAAVLREQERAKVEVAHIVREIQAGRLPPIAIGPSRESLEGVLFDAAEVQRTLNRLRKETDARDWMLVTDVALRLSIPRLMVYTLEKEGYISRVDAQEAWFRYETASVEAFRSRWVSVREIAETSGSDLRSTRIALENAEGLEVLRLEAHPMAPLYARTQLDGHIARLLSR